jgi:hypothetical protein
LRNEDGKFNKHGNLNNLANHEKMMDQTPVFDDKNVLKHNRKLYFSFDFSIVVDFPLNKRSAS